MPLQEMSLGHTGEDVLHTGCRRGTVIGTEEGHKDGCGAFVRL